MTEPGREQYGDDLFSHHKADEDVRLDAISRTHDPATRARLSRIVRPGMRCVDVGAGLGRVAGWLAEQVAPGEVLALDRETRMLEPLRRLYPSIEVLSADVTDPDCDPGRFDLVHTRMLLMHLRQRVEVFHRLASWVAPGGWIVLGDTIDVQMFSPPEHPVRRLMEAHWPVLEEAIGTDRTWAPNYPRLLREAGFVDVGVELYHPPITSTSAAGQFWQMNFAEVRDRVLAAGVIDEATYDAAQEALRDPGFADVSMGLVTAWGRRP